MKGKKPEYLLLCYSYDDPSRCLPQSQFTLPQWSMNDFLKSSRVALKSLNENEYMIFEQEYGDKKYYEYMGCSIYVLCNGNWKDIDPNFRIKLPIISTTERKIAEMQFLEGAIKSVIKHSAILEYKITNNSENREAEKQILKWCRENKHEKVEFYHGKFWDVERGVFINDEAIEYLYHVLK